MNQEQEPIDRVDQAIEHDAEASAAAEAALAVDAETLLRDAAGGMRKEFRGGTKRVALFAAQRAAVLSTLAGQRGFEQAVIAERDAVALEAGMEVGRQAAGVDQRVLGIIQSFLFMGAKKLAGL